MNLLSAEQIAFELGNAKRSGYGFSCTCPAHDDKHASLSIKEDGDKFLWKCHTGCSQEAVRLALKSRNLLPEYKSNGKAVKSVKTFTPSPSTTPDVIYDYTDEEGNVLFRKLRYLTGDPEHPKEFRQEAANGSKSLRGIRKVLYNLPAVIRGIEQGSKIYVVEGEKDVENLKSWGLIATTNPDGAATTPSKWTDAMSETLRGADVVLIPDNDKSGRAHVRYVARQIIDIANSVKIVPLYDPETGRQKGDVSDWIEEGHKLSELRKLVEQAEYVTAESINADEKNVVELREEEPILNTAYVDGEKFIEYFGDDFRYTKDRGWCAWNGKTWNLNDQLEVLDRANQLHFKIALEAETKPVTDKGEYRKWVRRLQGSQAVKSLMTKVQPHKKMRATEADFDCDPLILNCNNGTLNLATREFRPHKREDLLTRMADVDYDPNAECPRWIEFLKEITQGDEEMIDFLQRAGGYTISGFTHEQKIFFAYGGGGNGKSKFLGPIEKILGTYAKYLRANAFMEKQHETQIDSLAGIAGARMVRSSEISQNARVNEAIIKDLSGGEKVKARYLNHEPFDFEPKCKLWLHGNHKPRISGTDYGIWRRMLLIPFEFTVSDDKKDGQLEEKLLAEKSGILNWLIDGFLLYYTVGHNGKRIGLTAPKKITDATKEYESESDTLGQFLADRTEPAQGLSVKISDLYKAYEMWCIDNGFQRSKLTSTAFGIDLRKRGYKKGRNSSARYYENLHLLPEDGNSESSNSYSDNDREYSGRIRF